MMKVLAIDQVFHIEIYLVKTKIGLTPLHYLKKVLDDCVNNYHIRSIYC